MAGHRSTLKKANKAFKTPHSSKRSIKALNKGKVEKNSMNNKPIKIQSKNERKNYKNQIKKNKINKSLIEQSLFKSNKIERIITVLPLTKNLTPLNIINQILSLNDLENFENIESNFSEIEGQKIFTIKINKFNSNLKFIIPDLNNLISILDCCKISDFVIFGLSAIEEIDSIYGEQIIRSVEAQGISTTFAVLPDLVTNYPKKNLQLDIYKSLFSYYQHFFPNVEKLFILENKNDSVNLLRILSQNIPKGINWRDLRGYLLADNLDKFQTNNNENYLTIDGIVRGNGFNINGLIHVPGFGDYQIEKIEKLVIKGDNEIIISNDKESLDKFQNINDDLSMDEDEMDSDSDSEYDEDFDLVNKKIISEKNKLKRLPKGVSEYQAKWMKEDELEDLINEVGLADENDNEENDDEIMDTNNDEDIIEDDDFTSYKEISEEERVKQLEEYRKKENDELVWPDEIELRYDEIATKRLSKYRGVKSLASSLWDYDENDKRRPENWLNYFRLKNYKTFKNKTIKNYKNVINVVAGDKVRISIKFDVNDLNKLSNPKIKPFIISSLFSNENKLSVCNFSISTWESYENPIKSKDSMIVQYGFRRYHINPLFSQQSRNSNNVTKFQRFLHKGQMAIATAILPVSFTKSPALFFKSDLNNGGNLEILCQGTFENTDFTRILAKRIVLTGEVFKIHKSMVTIRFMFFNSDDVNAYKNVPLFTRMGRSGFIKESLGTHGEFKAQFDAKLNAQDIVGMELFKRVWPKEGSPVPF